MNNSKQPSTNIYKAGPWIHNPGLDFLFYILTPLLVIPLIVFFSDTRTSLTLALLSASFMGLGHHLPSFLRAYGDRLLFKQYKWRFIIAPIILIPLATFYIFNDLKAYYFIMLLWICWHSGAQIFGIGRIFDAKLGFTDSLTARLDWALILVGFFAVILLSPWRLGGYLTVFYHAGGPYLSSQHIQILQILFISVFIVIILVYFFHYFKTRSLFPLTNHLKLCMFFTNLGMWYVAFVEVKNVIIGLLIWEIIHWVQVTPLTWSYNNYRSNNVKGVGTFLQNLFSTKKVWMVIYVSIVLGYGSIGLIPKIIETDFFYKLATAVLVSSGILHFYYEGFTWKVRSREIQQGMGLQPSGGNPLRLLHPEFKHALLWVIFAIPLALLTYTQLTSTRTPLEIYQKIIEVTPRCWYSQYNVAVELDDIGEANKAALHYQKSIDINPEYMESHLYLSKILIGQKKYSAALTHLQKAEALEPDNFLVHTYRGNALFRLGRKEEARSQYKKSIALNPNDTEAPNNLAFIYLKENNLAQAEKYFKEAIDVNNSYTPAKVNLAQVHLSQNKYTEAKSELQAAIKLKPHHATALQGLSFILKNHPNVEKRDTTLALEYENRISAGPREDPDKVQKKVKKSGTLYKPGNTKIL